MAKFIPLVSRYGIAVSVLVGVAIGSTHCDATEAEHTSSTELLDARALDSASADVGTDRGALTTAPDAALPAADVLPPLSPYCQAACTHADEDGTQWSICYSCKCKQALGDLPAQVDATCAAGKDIHVFTATLVDGAVVEKDEPDDVAACDNPALLDSLSVTAACVPGGKLGQGTLPNGTVYKFICRRKPGAPRDQPPRYIDHGIIAHNPANGATCFWADKIGESDGVLPAIDLTDGDQTKIDAYTAFWGASDERAEGVDCIDCHDNDPFMYSPHLKSVFDFGTSSYRSSGFAQVRVDGPPTPVPHKHLVSPEISACTSCHRISDGDTCDRWATISAGAPETLVPRPYQPDLMVNPASYFSITTWMPHPLPPDATPASWEETYRPTIDFIQNCCANREQPQCVWQDAGAFTGTLPDAGAPIHAAHSTRHR